MDGILRHFETMVATMVFWYLQGSQIIPGFLRWCRISFIHSRSPLSFLSSKVVGLCHLVAQVGTLKNRSGLLALSLLAFLTDMIKPRNTHIPDLCVVLGARFFGRFKGNTNSKLQF